MSEALETGAEAPAVPVEPEVVQTAEPEKVEPKVYTQEEVDRIAAKVRANAAYRAKKEAEVQIYKDLATKQPEVQQPAVIPDAEPKRESFDDYESYIEARAEWKALETIRRAKADDEKRSAEQARAKEAQTQASRYESSVATARAETPDFDDVVSGAEIPVTPAIRDAILESDNPAKLQYHLAKNPSEIERISKLSPVQQVKAIGAIEATLASPARTTSAPAPVRPIGSGPAQKPLASMSMEEYAAYRRAQG